MKEFLPTLVGDSKWKEFRPSSVVEEVLQLEVALALSLETAAVDAAVDEFKLQMAMNESKTDLSIISPEKLTTVNRADAVINMYYCRLDILMFCKLFL